MNSIFESNIQQWVSIDNQLKILNEKIKEDLVMNYGAWEAKSTLFNQGVVIIPEKFLETIIRWEKDTDEGLIKKGIDKILESTKWFPQQEIIITILSDRNYMEEMYSKLMYIREMKK